MRSAFYIVVILSLFSCSKEHYSISNINGNEIDVLGHGGMGYNSSYPMNSLESLMHAVNSGANGTEMDVQLTKDSILIAFHDHSLDENTTGTGKVADNNWDEISTVQYDQRPFGNYKLTKIKDVISNIQDLKGHSLTFDCKVYPSGDNSDQHIKIFAEQIKAIFSEYDLYGVVIIEASNIDFIDELRSIDPNIRILFYPDTFEQGYQTALDHGLHGITISMHKITKEQIEMAHNSGLYVTIWQARTRKNNIEAIQMSPDMIQSDRLNHLIRELK